MESTETKPVFVDNVVSELFIEQCSFDDISCEWQDLEHFWGEEKHRLQVIDGKTKPPSSSFEEHLLHDYFLNEPQKKIILVDDGISTKIIRGDRATDVPTTYAVKGYKPQELVVFGTYVDKQILPGFRYKVRRNLSEDYLFDGKGKYLESIGLGYGKRITFEGDTLNENENYFWSDSAVHGYGFTLQAISEGDRFNIFDTKIGRVIGRILINDTSLEDDVVMATSLGERGYVEKEVKVKFSCNVTLNDSTSRQNVFVRDVLVQGKAILVKESSSSKAKVIQIFLDDFIMDSCMLVHEE